MENINREIAFFRDTFLESESELLDQLKQHPNYKKIIQQLQTNSASEIFNRAMEIYELFETDQIEDSELENKEMELVVLLSAIEDAVREKVREKLPFRRLISHIAPDTNSSYFDPKQAKGADDGFGR